MAEMQLEGLDATTRTASMPAITPSTGRGRTFLKIAAGYYLADPPQDRESRQRARRGAGRRLGAGANLPDRAGGGRGLDRLARGDAGISSAPSPACRWARWCCPAMTPTCRRRSGTAGCPGRGSPAGPLCPPFARRIPGAPADWLPDTAPDPARNRLISLALRPAPVTDQWIEEGPCAWSLIPATRLTLIEAAQPGEPRRPRPSP